jgi:hypothetical protein
MIALMIQMDILKRKGNRYEAMAKTLGHRGSTRASQSKLPPRIKLFRPISWYDGITARSVGEYVSHMLLELGRLGLNIDDIESRSRPPNRETVLSDLIDWLSDHPGKAFAQLSNWQTLDLAQIRSRLEQNRSAKPRIELSAHITKMNNLSVRWYPGGWRDTEFDWHRTDHSYFNLITHRKWRQPPDFHWFTGDEDPTFDSRPSNELMYIRGVGNLRPEPRDSYGPYAIYNADVVDSILICAVRAAHEGLHEQLAHSFEVTAVDVFDFKVRDEVDDADPSPYRSELHRVVAWSIEDAAELKTRREGDAAAAQDKRDRAEFAGVTKTYGFSVEMFVAALLHASSKKPSGPIPSREHINRNTAKDLRNAGFSIDAGGVRRVRQLIERYSPKALPESLRPEETPPAAPLLSNVFRLHENER